MRAFDEKSAAPINLSGLTGMEYQTRIFERLVHILFGDPAVLEMRDFARGEVDYVVHERPGKGMLATNRFHYFECKNYSRSLELDAVAKVMVVAVSDQPVSVHVVSRTPLQPQIRKYASRLFSFDGSDNPIFRGVQFRHWQTGSILEQKEEQEAYEVDSATGPGFASIIAGEVHWWLSECSAFAEAQLASSERKIEPLPSVLDIRHGSLLTLKIDFKSEYETEVVLDGLPSESWRQVQLSEQSDDSHYVIDTGLLQPTEEYNLSIRLISKVVDRRIPLARVRASGSTNFLPELRIEEIRDLVSKLGAVGDVRLMLVEGEAGVGKTHLIERTAEELRAKAGFDILRVTVPEDPDDELMASLIRDCLMPVGDKDAFKEVASQIEIALLQQEVGGSLKTDFCVLARVASRMGPRVIVLRDCHLVTTKLAEQLWLLISVFDDASWGGVRLVMEYRQPDAETNPALQRLLRKIRLNVRRVLCEMTVSPLSRNDFARFSKNAFAHVTEELSNCLFNRTGGYPLFIETYLRRLENLELVRRSGTQFEINQPAGVLADSLPAARQLILEELVRSGLNNTFSSDWEKSAMALGLIATADNNYGQALIRRAVDMPGNLSHVYQSMLKDAGVGSVLPDGQIVFRHDLLREAVATVASAVKGFESRARQVADNLFSVSPIADEVKVRAIRVKIFALLGDDISCELELRNALSAAQREHDYGHIVTFINHLLLLLRNRPNLHERLMLMQDLAWANWVSDSLLVARDSYLKLAAAAESNEEGPFSFSEDIATDAYRRAIGLDLELMEPRAFLENTIAVLGRKQDHLSFNSILNRIVLFCARFGFPDYGYQFAELSFSYIGDGTRDNEGSVLSSELGMLHAVSSPATALDLFKQAQRTAAGRPEQVGTQLAVHVHECMYYGKPVDNSQFDAIWRECTENRLTEPLARASLLRGSVLLREGNLKSAARWLERTATMVQLYHMKQYEMAILNDQVIHALLNDDVISAANFFKKLVQEFDRVEALTEGGLALIEKTYAAAQRAAESLPMEQSEIWRPSAPPAYCDPAAEMRQNIAGFAALLGQRNMVQADERFRQAGTFLPINQHRLVSVSGTKLVLGAY